MPHQRFQRFDNAFSTILVLYNGDQQQCISFVSLTITENNSVSKPPTSLEAMKGSIIFSAQRNHLSHNNACFPCNIAITNFLVSHTYEIRFHDVIGRSNVHMYTYAKILKYGRPTWPHVYVLDPYFSV